MTLSKIFLLLLALTESGNKDIPAYEGDATGPFQEKVLCVEEANRVLYLQDPSFGKDFFELKDRHDYWMAKSIAYVVIDHWKPILEDRYKKKWGPYDAVAFWLYGPNKWRPTSVNTEESKKRNKRYDYYRKHIDEYLPIGVGQANTVEKGSEI